jgi:hypothetical protein
MISVKFDVAIWSFKKNGLHQLLAASYPFNFNMAQNM